MCRQANGQVHEYEMHVHAHMKQMNIVCVCSMYKIVFRSRNYIDGHVEILARYGSHRTVIYGRSFVLIICNLVCRFYLGFIMTSWASY